jgi:uncharacterized RDD family membrane protein YckC
MRTATLQIRTPEGVRFSQLLAGPVTRFLAWIIDALCILGIVIIVGILGSVLAFVSPDFAAAFNTIAYFVISIGYGIFCEWRLRGQTIGKRIFRLRVVDAEGLRLQFHQVVTRNLLRFVDMLPLFYFVGGVTVLFSRSCQRLGDIAANTIVIRHPKLSEPDLDQLLAGKFNSLREHPHLAARLRQRVTPAEAALAVQALMRRDQFDPVDRVELFSELAAHFKTKSEFPSDAIDGITDEQYLRNVVDIVYRTRVEKTEQKAAA